MMRVFFAPATALMNRLMYPQKFVLIGLVLLLPLAWVLNQYVGMANDDIQFTETERIGVQYLEPLRGLLIAVQTHMEINAAARHDSSFNKALVQSEQEIEDQIAIVDAIDAQIGGTLNVTDSWGETKKQWETLKRNLAILNDT